MKDIFGNTQLINNYGQLASMQNIASNSQQSYYSQQQGLQQAALYNQGNEIITDELLDKLENAIENRECFVIGNDWEMVNQWDEQIKFILEKIYGKEDERL